MSAKNDILFKSLGKHARLHCTAKMPYKFTLTSKFLEDSLYAVKKYLHRQDDQELTESDICAGLETMRKDSLFGLRYSIERGLNDATFSTCVSIAGDDTSHLFVRGETTSHCLMLLRPEYIECCDSFIASGVREIMYGFLIETIENRYRDSLNAEFTNLQEVLCDFLGVPYEPT